jgi:spermidine synthase
MNKDGIFVTQISEIFRPTAKKILENLNSVFNNIKYSNYPNLAYGGLWGSVFCSNNKFEFNNNRFNTIKSNVKFFNREIHNYLNVDLSNNILN